MCVCVCVCVHENYCCEKKGIENRKKGQGHSALKKSDIFRI